MPAIDDEFPFFAFCIDDDNGRHAEVIKGKIYKVIGRYADYYTIKNDENGMTNDGVYARRFARITKFNQELVI